MGMNHTSGHGVITGVHADQKLHVCHVARVFQRFTQEIRRAFLAMLPVFTQLNVQHEAIGVKVRDDWRIVVMPLVSTADTLFVGLLVIQRRHIDIQRYQPFRYSARQYIVDGEELYIRAQYDFAERFACGIQALSQCF